MYSEVIHMSSCSSEYIKMSKSVYSVSSYTNCCFLLLSATGAHNCSLRSQYALIADTVIFLKISVTVENCIKITNELQ